MNSLNTGYNALVIGYFSRLSCNYLLCKLFQININYKFKGGKI
jgi:hypothetical protein